MVSWNMVCTSAGFVAGLGFGPGLAILIARAALRMALRAALAMRPALVVGRASVGRRKVRNGSGICSAASASFVKVAAMVIGASPSMLTAPRWGGPFVVKTTCTGKDGRGQCLACTRSVISGRRPSLCREGQDNPQGLALRPDGLAGTTNQDEWQARLSHAALRAPLHQCSSCRSAVGHAGQPVLSACVAWPRPPPTWRSQAGAGEARLDLSKEHITNRAVLGGCKGALFYR